MKLIAAVVSCALTLAMCSDIQAVTWNVPADAPTIQAGIDSAAAGDTVLVASGTYTGDGNRDIDFEGKDIVVRSENGPELTTIDSEGGVGDPHRAFWFGRGDNSLGRVEGFTIRGGYETSGGGVFCDSARVWITDCVFTGNYAAKGSGVYVRRGSGTFPRISGCDFIENSGGLGSGIHCGESSFPHIEFCTFARNTADNGGGVAGGDCWGGEITDCVFTDNVALGGGGAVRSDYYASPLFTRCVFSGNSAAAGGAVCCGMGPGNVKFWECVFTENSADTYGGAIDCRDHSGLPLTSCTFSGNSAGTSGGSVSCRDQGTIWIRHSIIAFSASGEAVYVDASSDITDILCSDIYGNAGGDWVGRISSYEWINDNISEDPLFCDAAAGDCHLWESSPCVDGHGCGQMGALGVGCAGRVWIVDADGTPGLDCDCSHIQACIDSAPAGDMVLVMEGTYGGDGNRDIDFGGKNLLLRSTAGAQVTIIDCGGSDVDPHRGFQFHGGEGAASLVEGFTVTGGYADSGGAAICVGSSPRIRDCVLAGNTASLAGGAVCFSGSSSELAGCTIVSNSGTAGGGLACYQSSNPAVERTIVAFSDEGEAVACDISSEAVLACCDVYGNAGGDWVGCIAGQSGTDGNFSEDPLLCNAPGNDFRLFVTSPCVVGYGCGRIGALSVGCRGAWYVDADGTPGMDCDCIRIQDCIDLAQQGDTVLVAAGTYTGDGNRDMDYGGKTIVVRSESGSAVTIIDSEGSESDPYRAFVFETGEPPAALLDGFTITGGFAVWGGGIHCGMSSSPTIRNCVFYGNTAEAGGGAISARTNSAPIISHCTLAYNSTLNVAGGLLCDMNASPPLDHTIIAFSTSGSAVHCNAGGSPTLHCCDVYGNAGGDWVECIADQYGVNGNISADPEFCDPDSGDFSIRGDSPCAPGYSLAECGLIGALDVGCALTRVAEVEITLPTALCLGPAIPNPFNPITEISYGIPAGAALSRAVMHVYDALGRRVTTLVDTDQGPGEYRVVWDGRDHKGAEVASGVYFYRITWNGKSETRRMILLK